MRDHLPTELARRDFEQIISADFAFLADDFSLIGPLFSEFGGLYYAIWEGADSRVMVWCSSREDDVWTFVQRIGSWRTVGLDTADDILGNDGYPPSGSWSDPIEDRLRLEARILRRNADSLLLADESIFDEAGSPIVADVVELDDPSATFPRRCSDRFKFLEEEFGLVREFAGHGGSVIWRGPSRAVQISLNDTLYEWEEDEGSPAVYAELIELEDGRLPVFADALDELEIPERTGPFTVDYMERAFDDLEVLLREREGMLRG
jgi:hypothetical protein